MNQFDQVDPFDQVDSFDQVYPCDQVDPCDRRSIFCNQVYDDFSTQNAHSSEPSFEAFDTPIPTGTNNASHPVTWGPSPLKNLKLWLVYPQSLQDDAFYLSEWFAHRSGIQVYAHPHADEDKNKLQSESIQSISPFSCTVHLLTLQEFLHGIEFDKSYFLFVYHESAMDEYTALVTRCAWFSSDLMKRCRVTSLHGNIPTELELFVQHGRQKALWSLIRPLIPHPSDLLHHEQLWQAYQSKVLYLEKIQSIAYLVAAIGLLGICIGIWGQGSAYALASTLLYMFACLIWGVGSIAALWSWLDLRAFKQRVLLYWIDPSLNTAADQLKKKSNIIKYKFK